MDRHLDVRLDLPLPRSIGVGAGTALFVAGSCFCPQAPIRALALRVDGAAQPVMAHGMPRLDLFRALHPRLDAFSTRALRSDPDSPEDPLMNSYSSGFWGVARVGPTTNEEIELELVAELEDGEQAVQALASVVTAAPARPATNAGPAGATGPLVAIAMATYDPPAELLRRQLESIRAQTHRNWVCLVSDDCSNPERFAVLERELAGDERFVLSRSERRLGFYHNFERALGMAPREADAVAMSDQDDVWHPEKLATLIDGLGEAQLVYSDARVIDGDGQVRSETYWALRRNNHTSLSSLLMANSVTGAASLARRELLDVALPFPPAQFAHFHDHWVALCALALGNIAYVDRPLYDYVQHGSAVLGHAAANRGTRFGDRLAKLGEDPRERVKRWRMHFFVDNCRLIAAATVLLMRVGDRMASEKRRQLEGFVAADRSPVALARLAARIVPELRGRPETLGAEVGLTFAFAWRRLLAASARGQRRPRRRLRLDAVPPTDFAPRPGRVGPQAPGPRTMAEKIAPLELMVRDDAPERVNLLVPTIDLAHFFGGYIAKFNLARRLAERGARVRIVTVDPVGPLPRDWKEQVESYQGLTGALDSVEVAFGREAAGLEVSRSDRFVASTWWSAHVAAAAMRSLGGGPFLYLIQEYEPLTFPAGTWSALARESYRLPHRALFSTELLRGYFRRHRVGVYRGGAESGERESVSFQNAITAIDAPSADELRGRSQRRLLFYARPEPHAARNMFELGVLALDRALERGAFAGWELHGIGTVEGSRRIALGGGASLELLPRSGQAAYAGVLRDHDVGLALMDTPHPSLVPLEMASAGMVTVTNSFENKTPEALAAISANLSCAEPTIDALAGALGDASASSGDAERRAAGSRVNWSSDWDRSFDDSLMERVEALTRA